MRARRPRYRVYDSGEWLRVPQRGVLVACCDCHLVHLVRARVTGGNRIAISARRMARNTGGIRAGMVRKKR
jgi:hypothetical protein